MEDSLRKTSYQLSLNAMILDEYKPNGGEGFVDAADLRAAGQVRRGEDTLQVYYWNVHANLAPCSPKLHLKLSQVN